mgnify:CR=1 FL=1
MSKGYISPEETARKVNHTGTSEHAIEVAMSQYLNPTGSGDYDLP